MGVLSFAGALDLSYVLPLLRVGKFRDIRELPPNLKNWFLDVFGGCLLCGQFIRIVCAGLFECVYTPHKIEAV